MKGTVTDVAMLAIALNGVVSITRDTMDINMLVVSNVVCSLIHS